MKCRRCFSETAFWCVCAVALLSGCIRDTFEPCPALNIRLEVTDKNYINVKAASRLGLEDIRSEELPFTEYVSSLYYRLTELKTGKVVMERTLEAVPGECMKLEIPVDAAIPHGNYVFTAWGNLSDKTGEQLKDNPDILTLHPGNLPGNDVYMVCDTLAYNENEYAHTLGLKRVKGKLIVSVEDMPEVFRYSEKDISDISGQVDTRWTYSQSLSFHWTHVWEQTGHCVTKACMAPSTGPSETLFKIRFHKGEGAENTEWIAAENVSVTLERNKLTVLRYIYDPCCCRFKIYALVNDNWELLHAMEID